MARLTDVSLRPPSQQPRERQRDQGERNRTELDANDYIYRASHRAAQVGQALRVESARWHADDREHRIPVRRDAKLASRAGAHHLLSPRHRVGSLIGFLAGIVRKYFPLESRAITTRDVNSVRYGCDHHRHLQRDAESP
jgi:hypothetical protein